MCSHKIGGMSPEDFEGLLRPAVEQDEWKLVAVGAALGAVGGELLVYSDNQHVNPTRRALQNPVPQPNASTLRLATWTSVSLTM